MIDALPPAAGSPPLRRPRRPDRPETLGAARRPDDDRSDDDRSDDDFWDDEDDGYPARPRSQESPRGPALRETLADRLPLPARHLSAIPRLGALGLLLAATVVGVLWARSSPADQDHTVIAARTAVTQARTSSAAREPGTVGDASGGSARSGTASVLVVDVTGRVRRPGLVRLAPGSRVWDAVVAAGGITAGARLDRVNLARPLADGEQILIPGPNDPVPSVAGPATGAGGGTGTPGSPGGVLDLNTATEAQLDQLPGIGPVLAARIVAWRTDHGRFSRVEELAEVAGIGDTVLARLRPLVRV